MKGNIGTQLIDLNEYRGHFFREKRSEQGTHEEVDTFFGRIESSFTINEQLRSMEDSDEEFEINNYSRIRVDLSNKNVVIPAKDFYIKRQRYLPIRIDPQQSSIKY